MTKYHIAVITLCLCLTACTSDQITKTLEAVVDAAIAADAIARPQDAPYLALATGCLDTAETILAGVETPAIKATKISAACATVVAAGVNAPVGVQAVAAALNTFLQAVTTTQTQLQLSGPVNSFAPTASGTAKVDKKALDRIRKKLDDLKARKGSK